MEERTFRWRRTAGFLAAVVLVTAACSSGGNASTAPTGGGASAPAGSEAAGSAPAGSGGAGGSVSVIGTWTGAEQDAFLAMVAPWAVRLTWPEEG